MKHYIYSRILRLKANIHNEALSELLTAQTVEQAEAMIASMRPIKTDKGYQWSLYTE